MHRHGGMAVFLGFGFPIPNSFWCRGWEGPRRTIFCVSGPLSKWTKLDKGYYFSYLGQGAILCGMWYGQQAPAVRQARGAALHLHELVVSGRPWQSAVPHLDAGAGAAWTAQRLASNRIDILTVLPEVGLESSKYSNHA